MSTVNTVLCSNPATSTSCNSQTNGKYDCSCQSFAMQCTIIDTLLQLVSVNDSFVVKEQSCKVARIRRQTCTACLNSMNRQFSSFLLIYPSIPWLQ